jgi:hypothetical protein
MPGKVNKSSIPTSATVAARNWYRGIAWDEWWDEFCFSINKNGSMKYRTAWHFAKTKGKNNQEASWIYQSIGPAPKRDPDSRKALIVPYQGDWYERREKGFWMDPDGTKLEVLKEAIKNKTESLETLRHLAVVPAKLIDLYQNVASKIIAHYGGQPCLPDLSEEENYKRAKNLLILVAKCQNGISGSIDDLAKCMGLHPGAPDKWAELAVLSAEQGAKAALAGQSQGLKQGIGVGASYVQTLTNMVHMTLQKSKAFDLPLPEGDDINGQTRSELPATTANR